MAASETHPTYHYKDNNCIIQEHLKKFPKFGSTKLQPYSNEKAGRAAPKCIPLSGNPGKRCLQQQSKLGYQKDIILGLPTLLEDNESSSVLTQVNAHQEPTAHFDNDSSNSFIRRKEVKHVNGVNDYLLHGSCPNLRGYSMMREKSKPWWRIADKDELALLVEQKSYGSLQNCDLPQPFHHLHDFLLDPSSYVPNISKYDARSRNVLKPRKAELLEALCHFQTIARKAQSAAHQAQLEKHQVAKLLFEETSDILTYRNWLYTLQLECFSQRLMLKEHNAPSLFPLTFLIGEGPFRRKKIPKQNIWRYALGVFAGLSLAFLLNDIRQKGMKVRWNLLIQIIHGYLESFVQDF